MRPASTGDQGSTLLSRHPTLLLPPCCTYLPVVHQLVGWCAGQGGGLQQCLLPHLLPRARPPASQPRRQVGSHSNDTAR